MLGRYEILDEVGQGGMATVFRARDRDLRREVAIKVLFPHLARRAEVVQRFAREARAAASLAHPNILAIHDVGGGDAAGAGGDPPFIVMELVRGRTLAAELEQRGPLLAELVACIGALLGGALAVAHAAGIVHRDIKPANLMITAEGRLLLADFGVARFDHDDSLATRTGALLGTPAYMSPEQARGDHVDARSDIYSLGATLYQLATGSLPYAGPPVKVIAAIVAGPPMPAVRRRPAVGDDLSRALDRAMASDPAARPADAAALATELAAIATAGGLGDPATELAAYLADPEAHAAARTATVVASLVTAARGAVRVGRLPRAMALADRAAALAPTDPSVTALVTAVTAGGRSRRRRAALAATGIAVALGGSMVAVAMVRAHRFTAAHPDAAVADASRPVIPADAPPPDAATPHPDALAPRPDAAIAAIAVTPRPSPLAPRPDAAVIPADAAVADASPPDAALAQAPAAPGAIIIDNDIWCDITIDNQPRGRTRYQPLPVPAGHHSVTCAQPGNNRGWTHDIDVAPGQTVTARGAMLGPYRVTLAVRGSAVVVMGQRQPQRYRPGAVIELPGGRLEIDDVGVVREFVSIRENCTLRDLDDHLTCDP